MQVEYHPPSELDATVRTNGDKLQIMPKFYQPKGAAIIGTLKVVDSHGQIRDRAILSVTGSGKVTVTHRTEEVVPVADNKEKGDSKDGGSAKPKSNTTHANSGSSD